MPKYTDEQIERANNADVRTFLEQTEGYSFEGRGRFVKCKNAEHTNQPSSLSIDTHLNRIFYNSVTGNRPLSAVDWCTKIKNMDFQTAMKCVLEEEPQGARAERPKFEQHRPQPEISAPKNLELSEKSDTSKNVYAYLTETRGIPQNIVNDCLKQSFIYQDVRKNAVFVGYDSDNRVPKYAARRGTFTPDGKEPFKRDCTGSDKNFAFRLEGKNTETVYVAEAAIDVLSLAALENKWGGVGAYKEKTYLSTGGAGIDSALEQFCKTHDVKTINVCFDDDEAGKNGMEKIMQKFRERGITVNDMRASMAHDYNDELVAFNNNPNLYSKPPDVVKSVSENIQENDREDINIPPHSQNSNDYEFGYDTVPPDELAYMTNSEPDDYIPFDDYTIPDEQNCYEQYYEPPYEPPYQERNDIMPEVNISQEEAVSPPQTEQPEMQGLFSTLQNGEIQYYKTDKTAKELLQISANSERPYAEMTEHGERISETDYAEIQQSSKFKFSVDMNFDDNSARLYAVNMGKGGISEADRTDDNVYFKTVQLSDYVKEFPEKAVPDMPRKPEKTVQPKPQEKVKAISDDLQKRIVSPTPEQPQKGQEEKTVNISERAAEQINPEEKMNRLLAFAKDNQERKRAELLDKISEIDSKIADRQERVEKLSNKISDIESSLKTHMAFKRTFGNTLLGKIIDSRIEKKQAKIKEIYDVKIPKQQDKITVQTEKKSKVTEKLGRVNRKIDRIDKVHDFLSAIGSSDREKRHQGFVTGLENLSDIRRENLENKLHKTEAKIDMLSAKYSSPGISHSERHEIGKSIRALKEKASDLTDKIENIHKLHGDLEDMKNGKFSENEIEKAVCKTADKVSDCISNPDGNSEKGVINTMIEHSVNSGSEAISEVISEKAKAMEQAEKSEPVTERERVPEERQPDVSKSKELDILTMAAVITGVNISEFNRLPAEIKADVIAEFQENHGNISTEQLAKRICDIADIEPPKEIKAQEQPVQTDESKEKDKTLDKNHQSITDKVVREQTDDDKPLFSRSKLMSDEFKPASEKSQEDLNKKKDRNIGI